MFVPLNCKSEYSFLHGYSLIDEIVARCKELGVKSCGLTDYNLCGAFSFWKKMTAAGLKPLIGYKITLSNGSYVTLIARNKQGWLDLVKINSTANSEGWNDKEERAEISPECLEELLTDNLIELNGSRYSSLAALILEGDSTQLREDWREKAAQYILSRNDRPFFLECQNIGNQNRVLMEALRELGPKLGVKCVAVADPFYSIKEHAEDQRLWTCIGMKTTRANPSKALTQNPELIRFFLSDDYYIREPENLPEEIATTLEVADLCEEFSLANKPLLPHVDKAKEKLRAECEAGWVKKIQNFIPPEKQVLYRERLEMELGVLHTANLDSYFLIVADFCRWADDQGIIRGMARGSAGGCLTSYLLNITQLDPIPYNLIFERFYNVGREKGGLCDIDCDIQVKRREEVIQYLRDKYGHKNVAQIVTFGRLMGRAALSEVLRVNDVAEIAEIKRLTEVIPDEAKIADDLQEMKEEGEEAKIIMWTLQNHPQRMRDYCRIEDGKLVGRYATYFEQALRIEGRKKSTGKHASGIVVSSESLYDFCPMIHDKSHDELLAGFDLKDGEAYGLVKLDVLGVNALDKVYETFNDEVEVLPFIWHFKTLEDSVLWTNE